MKIENISVYRHMNGFGKSNCPRQTESRMNFAAVDKMSLPVVGIPAVRTVVFISKATPGDDEFALWLAPRLEAAGYTVFADIVTLEPGDRWRKEITNTLQTRTAKMLLCCRDTTLARDNVQEEIGIGLELVKELPDPKFIIPLRLEPYKKVLGIGELQYIDFVRGWASGLGKLLEALKRQKVPCDTTRFRSTRTGRFIGAGAPFRSRTSQNV